MAQKEYNGVYQLDNGFWGYRFTKLVDGKRVNRKGSKTYDGKPLKTEKAALKARQIAIYDFEAQLNSQPKRRVTLAEVFEEYQERGRSGKAYATIKKQDSLWNNHLSKKFGERFIDSITVAEINDYLTDLYYVEGRAYRYVESFLKMFYLIFGQAYARGYMDMETYSRFCLTKECKISMPKMKVDDDLDIVVYDNETNQKIDNYFRGTNAETAYMLGRYCGLRVNECYGLKWDNVDIENGCIYIDRQMQYQDGIIKLVSLKTRNARRTVYLSNQMIEYFTDLKAQRAAAESKYKEMRQQKQTFLPDLDGENISCLELVNCVDNGKIQTINSMKYHAKRLKEKYGIHFKYHYLRHTYGTRLAEQNTPVHILCNQMGHASGKVTERYYLAVSDTGIEILKRNLNGI